MRLSAKYSQANNARTEDLITSRTVGGAGIRLKMRRISTPSVFVRMFISFLVILIIPITIGGYMYMCANNLVEKYSEDTARFMLEQNAASFDNFIENMDDSIYTLLRDTDILAASYLDRPEFGSKEITAFISLLNRIQLRSTSSLFSSRTVLFLKTPGAIVRRESVSFGIEEFYNSFLSYENYSYEMWRHEVLDSNRSKYCLPVQMISSRGMLDLKSCEEYITYVHSYPAISVIVLMEASSAKALLSEAILSEQGAALIVDGKNIVLSVGDETIIAQLDFSQPWDGADSHVQTIHGEEMMILCKRSASSGLQYISINPIKVTMKDAAYIRHITLVSILVIFSIGILASCLLSRKHSNPLREITTLLNVDQKKKCGYEYKFIKDKVYGLVATNKELSKTVDKQLVISRNLFSGQLLGGTLRDQQELEHYLEYFNIDLRGVRFTVLLLSCYHTESLLEQNIAMLALEDILSQGQCNKYIHMLDTKTFAVILGLPYTDHDENSGVIRDYLSTVLARLRGQHGIPQVGIGNQHRKLIDVNFSFEEARIALDSVESKMDTAVVWYGQLSGYEKCGYFYPLDLETKLISLVKMGRKNEVLRTLHQIYKENFTNRSLPKSVQTQLFYEMRSTVLKTLDELKYDIDAGQLLSMDFAAAPHLINIELFTQTYITLCDGVEENKKSHNDFLLQRIIEEINNNYADSSICVNSMADRFGISASYLPHFFKEQTGESFSYYLENIRMKAACTLLEQTDIPVESIAMAVGYNSTYSFRRAFKKNQGDVPSQYRLHMVSTLSPETDSGL